MNFNRFHFQGQKKGEKILLVLHRHWFDILKQLAVTLLMFLAMLIIVLSLPNLFPKLFFEVGGSFFLLLESFIAMFSWLIFFIIWIDYYFDVWIITSRRIVNIEQKGLFVRQVSELEIENIQDITTEVTGVIPTFLNFGDVFIQTAAEKERFLFHNVPNPYTVKDLVMNIQKKIEKKEAHNLGKIIQEKIKKT